MTADRRQKLTRIAYFAVAAIAVAGALVAPVVVPRWREADVERKVADSESAFGQHYTGMDARRRAARVPTMGEAGGEGAHVHPKLAVFVNGARAEVPPNIGIDPTRAGAKMAALHTHDSEGTIHVEGMRSATLGQFFAVWGVEFDDRRLGPHRAGSGRSIRMWVDGKPSREFGRLNLADGQHIVVAYGDEEAARPSP